MFPGIEEGTWTATKIREAREGEKEDLIAKQKAAMGVDQDEDEGDEDDEEEGEEAEDAAEKSTGDGVPAKSPTEGASEETDAAATGMADTTDELKKEETPPTPAKLKTQDSTMEGEEGDGEGDEDEDEDMGEEGVYVEDEDDEEGAVWCMKEGKVVDWGCFFALL